MDTNESFFFEQWTFLTSAILDIFSEDAYECGFPKTLLTYEVIRGQKHMSYSGAAF